MNAATTTGFPAVSEEVDAGEPAWRQYVPKRGGVALFDDPILGNSALDRPANGAHQVVIEGSTYRAKLAPNFPAAPAS
jgi:hypothetical protein